MASIINTNIPSINAQRNLTASQTALQTSLARLSSGLRINSAKDDAAGLSIAARMSAQIGGMEQAGRNANDGISMAQTAEGSMASIGDILLRMRTLAVQSANGSNSALDRQAIQAEVDQLSAEIDRISNTAEFNGVKLLNGAANTNTLQVGANANQTISLSIQEVSNKSMQLNSYIALGDLNGGRVSGAAPVATNNEFVINGKGVAFVATDTTATLMAAKINAATGTTGVAATAYNSVNGTAGASGIVSGMTIQVGSATAVTVSNSSSLTDLVDRINKEVGGVVASLGTKGELVISNDTGDNITVGGTANNSGLVNGTYRGYLSLKSGDGSAVNLTSTTAVGNGLNKFGFNLSQAASSVDSRFLVGTAAGSATVAVNNLNAIQGGLTVADDIKINGAAVGVTGTSAADKAAAINALHDQTGVTASAKTEAYLTVNFANGNISINGTSVAVVATDDNSTLVTKINAAGISGVLASTDAITGKLKLTVASGNDLLVGNLGTNILQTVTSDNNYTATAIGGANNFVGVRGVLHLSGDNGATVSITGTAASIAKTGMTEQGGAQAVTGGKLSVVTAAQAQQSITAIDRAIAYVNTQRSLMGAIQNRLSNVISNLGISVENISSARSRIQDADFAAETSAMTRNQILQQAGTAMLAQANSLSQSVLSLLKQ